ncbi:MAG: hypothetical protein ABGY96_05635 [bacterium]|nr:hypothetical protein [Gammaproteobacteria bacterium]HIL98636.1 hypothetical protein [Pseudomonadales bacterium]
MKVLAGTSRGIFSIENSQALNVLETRRVRDLVYLDGRLFAGTGNGLFVSNDEGESWQLAGLEDREVWQIRAASNDVLYASTQPAGLFRSEDGGVTWEEVTTFAQNPESDKWCIPVTPPLPASARALVIDRDNPAHLWVGVEVGGIMRSTDAGETWTLNLPGENPDLHMMFAHPQNPAVLFASTGYGRLDGVAEMIEGNAGVFRSDDGGDSWNYVWKGITPRYSRPMCIDSRPPFGLTVASAPTAFSSYKNEGGAGAMLFRSENEGESWRSLCDEAHSPATENFHGLIPDPGSPGGVLIGSDSGNVWQVSNDAEWKQLASGLPAVLSIVVL